jgi:hypothetical protein
MARRRVARFGLLHRLTNVSKQPIKKKQAGKPSLSLISVLFRPIPRARSAIPNFSYPHNKPRHRRRNKHATPTTPRSHKHAHASARAHTHMEHQPTSASISPKRISSSFHISTPTRPLSHANAHSPRSMRPSSHANLGNPEKLRPPPRSDQLHAQPHTLTPRTLANMVDSKLHPLIRDPRKTFSTTSFLRKPLQ